jgi:hypothetical protein
VSSQPEIPMNLKGVVRNANQRENHPSAACGEPESLAIVPAA